MAASPPLSPVAAPLGHRKRRHSEMHREGLDLTADDGDARKTAVNSSSRDEIAGNEAAGSGHNQASIEEESEEEINLDDQSLVGDILEDILDSAELEPFQPDGTDDQHSLSAETASKLREYLLKVGPERFFEDTMSPTGMPPAVLGLAFGLAPSLEEQLGQEMFMRILGHAIVRYYRKRQKLPQYNTIDDAAQLLQNSKNIIVITGAGISTSLGIPDFRSKGTGFYSKLLAEGISEPEEVFDIVEFDQNPGLFYKLAHGILPDETRHSPTHAFIRLLQDKGKLQTNYTQNIDNIEERAGIDKHRLIQCHGSFATATCRKCKYQIKGADIFPDIRAQQVARCKRCIDDIAATEAAPKKKPKPTHHRFQDDDDDDSADDDISEPGVMKPDITFFGEQLPSTFFDRLTERDSKLVDLVLVIGTSLKVAPVSEIPNYLPHAVPHIYISREPIEHVNFDVQLLGDCDSVVFELCRRAGWTLQHDMIPKDFQVSVRGIEGSEYRWNLRPGTAPGGEDSHATNGVESEDAGLSAVQQESAGFPTATDP